MTDPAPRRLRAGVYLVFLLSGACGLVYEVLWVRQLILVFGVSTYAVCTVLGAFMAGLALGSAWFGRRAVHARNPLALYGWLELGIGAAGLAMPLVFAALQRGYSWVYDDLADRPLLFTLVRAVVVGAVLVVPCTLMGGTVAVLSRFFATQQERVGRDLGLLYALNTLGAVAGCVLAGFLLIPELGLRHTTFLVVAGNGVAGLLALGLARSRGASPPAQDEAASGRGAPGGVPSAPREAHPAWFLTLVLVVFAVSGFCSLGYQVLWTRALVFYLHNSTYAFTTMLGTFLLGLSLGSLLLNRRVDRSRRLTVMLALTQVGIAVTTVAGLVFYAFLPLILARLLPGIAIDSFGKALFLQLAQAVVILLPITFLMGLMFPVVTRLCVRSLAGVSRSVGNLYSLNTLGCIFGSLVVGFLLLPRIGILRSFQVLLALNLLGALAVFLAARGLGLRGRLLGVGLVAAVWWGQWQVLPANLFAQAFGQGAEVLFYQDGVTDSVMVKAPPGDPDTRFLCFADGRGTAGTNTSVQNRFMAHLPLMLHPDPNEVLTICFGVGNTLSALAANPRVERVECVELSPSVIATAPWFPTNEGVIHDPKVTVRFQDGRNHLLGTSHRYDVIQLEPPEIHTDGVVNLYTREFYRLCQRRLKEGGILCQWLNVTMMPLEQQRQLVATMQETFPHTTMRMLTRGLTHVLLVGTPQELTLSYARVKAAFEDPVWGPDLRIKTMLPGPEAFLANFKLTEEGVRRFCAGATILTDDRTRVDFSVPRSVDANYGLSNAFSGIKVAGTLEGGVAPTLDYYADKQRTMMEAVEPVFPLLKDFASEEERERCRQGLDEELRRWREVQEQAIQALRRSRSVPVNT